MTSCDDILRLYPAALKGEVSSADETRVLEHLKTCADCASKLDITCAEAEAAVKAHLAKEALPPVLLDRLGEHIQDCDTCYERDWLTCDQFWEMDRGGAFISEQPDNTLYYGHHRRCKSCQDKYTARILRSAGIEPDDYPCICSANASALICELHDNAWDCPDVMMIRLEDGGFGLPVRDGGRAVSRISFCPYCGADLRPPTKM